MIDDETVARLRHHWDDGWNRGDVDVIMAPFAPEIVFTSPFVEKLTDPPVAAIEGADALRAYVEHALARTPGIRYEVHGAYAGVDTVLLVYTCFLPNDTIKHGADTMHVGDDGQVTGWHCHYSVDSLELTT
jgi:hypothetical protein